MMTQTAYEIDIHDPFRNERLDKTIDEIQMPEHRA